jgi:hypothetical protein
VGARGGDVRRGHDLLGERLAAFELGGRSGRPEDEVAVVAEHVGDAGDEGRFGTHDDEVGPQLVRQGEDGGRVGEVGQRFAARDRVDAGVARGGDHRGDRVIGGEPSHERVFPRSGAEDEDNPAGHTTSLGGPRSGEVDASTTARAGRGRQLPHVRLVTAERPDPGQQLPHVRV